MVGDNWKMYILSTIGFVNFAFYTYEICSFPIICIDLFLCLIVIFDSVVDNLKCSYMVEKNRKLQNQFDAEASTSSHSGSGSGKPIFDGVAIFVDGFTVPSSQVQSRFIIIFC